MVIEINTGNGFRGTISYVQKEHEPDLPLEQKPEIIEKNNIYGNTQEMAKQMRFVAKGNTRISKPVMHISISFDKSENLSVAQERKAVEASIKEIGLKKEDHQYLVVKHNDTPNPHYHVVINKVDLDGKKLNLGFDGKKEGFVKNRLQVIADKIEQEQGLRRTQGRNIVYEPNSEKGYRFLSADEKEKHRDKNRKVVSSKNPNIKNLHANIQGYINTIIKDRSITNAEQFKRAVESKGIDVKFSENRKGISGVSFKSNKISVKGSQIGAKWGEIDKALTTNAIYKKEAEIKAYIAEKAPKSFDTVGLVDDAIREKMLLINPNANVWETWNKNRDSDKLYNELHQYGEKMKEVNHEQKTAFEIAKEKREQGQGQSQEQSSKQEREFGNSFEKLKAQREEKSQEQSQNRGFSR